MERGFQCVTFEEGALGGKNAGWEPALNSARGRRLLRDKPLEDYVHELSEVRRVTLAGLAARNDEWLERPLVTAPAMNAHWAWFHVAEHEINHRGQIRWLRARLKGVAPGVTGA